MSPLPVRPLLHSCMGKQGFETQAMASQVAQRIRRRRDKAKVHAYRCRGCGYWHIGSVLVGRPR